jgi:hypothetical protein
MQFEEAVVEDRVPKDWVSVADWLTQGALWS